MILDNDTVKVFTETPENPFKMFDEIAIQIITNWPLLALVILGFLVVWHVVRKAMKS